MVLNSLGQTFVTHCAVFALQAAERQARVIKLAHSEEESTPWSEVICEDVKRVVMLAISHEVEALVRIPNVDTVALCEDAGHKVREALEFTFS